MLLNKVGDSSGDGGLFAAFTHSMNLLGCKGIYGRDYEGDISEEKKEQVTAAMKALGEI